MGESDRGGWIKVRANLYHAPEVIRIARELVRNRQFGDWLMSGDGDVAGECSTGALRAVALGLLFVTWAAQREHGIFIGEDLFLSGLAIDDLDEPTGAPGIGKAMEAVGWAVATDDGNGSVGVTLPRFKKYNVPMTAAERQKGYRERVTGRYATVTRPAQQSRHRVEESRGDEKREDLGGVPPKTPRARRKATGLSSVVIPEALMTDAFYDAWQQWLAYRREERKPLTATQATATLVKLAELGLAMAIESIQQSIRNGWQGLFNPKESGSGRTRQPEGTDPGRYKRNAKF